MTTNEDRDRLFGVVALGLGFILFAKTVTEIDKAGQKHPECRALRHEAAALLKVDDQPASGK